MTNVLEILERKQSVNLRIKAHQNSMKLLLDIATGYKALPYRDYFISLSFQNRLRLLSTLENLHRQIRELQKERQYLDNLLQTKEKFK